jgi:hypothetical protein
MRLSHKAGANDANADFLHHDLQIWWPEVPANWTGNIK